MYWTKKGKILGDVEGDLTRGIENREDWKWCIPGLTVMVNGLGLGWQTSVGKYVKVVGELGEEVGERIIGSLTVEEQGRWLGEWGDVVFGIG